MGRLYRATCPGCGFQGCLTSSPSDTCPQCRGSLREAKLGALVVDPAHNPSSLPFSQWAALSKGERQALLRELPADPREHEEAPPKAPKAKDAPKNAPKAEDAPKDAPKAKDAG